MDCPSFLLLTSFLSASFLICIIFFTHASKRSSGKALPLPPGPRPYPIIENLLELGTNPLLSLTRLAHTHGPIMSLKLASRTAIVISSPHIAKEAFQKNDQAFSSRTFPDGVRALDHHENSIAWIPVSPLWRALRRACTAKIFSPQQLDSTQLLRHAKVRDLIDRVREYSTRGEAVDLSEAAFTTVLNSFSNTLFSVDFADYGSGKCQEYKELLMGIMDEAGRPNVADGFPVLRFFDPQGVRARMSGYYKKLYSLFDGIMEERLRSRGLNDCSDVLDSFIDLIQEESSQLSRRHVLHLFLDLFLAGIDTTSSTLEWAMAELIRNPEKMTKAREELHQFVGENGKLEESQVSKLPFLQAVIKETLRLHPPAPFLLPRKANCDVELCGFLVPKNAQILVNVWAMGRDPSVWDNPNMFAPERFMESGIDFRGRDFELIPFGAGRRICPGLPLASRELGFMLASLLYHFEWKLPDGLKPENMDMSQNYGITLHKVQPLWAIPIRDGSGVGDLEISQ